MYDQHSKGISYSAGFFMLIAFTIAAFVLAGQLANLISEQWTGRPMTDLVKSGDQSKYMGLSKLIQALTAIVGFFFPALVTASLLNRKPVQLLGFKGSFTANQLLLSVLIMAAALFVANGFSYLTTQLPVATSWKERFDEMERLYSEQMEAIMNLKSPVDLILSIVIVGLITSICEETLFRGGMQNFLSRATGRPWMAIVITSIIFSLVHFSFYGFLSRVVLGIALGAVYHYSGRLWLCILAHFLNNSLLIVLLYTNLQQGKSISSMMQETKGSIWGLAAIPVLVFLIVVLDRISLARKRIA